MAKSIYIVSVHFSRDSCFSFLKHFGLRCRSAKKPKFWFYQPFYALFFVFMIYSSNCWKHRKDKNIKYKTRKKVEPVEKVVKDKPEKGSVMPGPGPGSIDAPTQLSAIVVECLPIKGSTASRFLGDAPGLQRQWLEAVIKYNGRASLPYPKAFKPSRTCGRACWP